MVKEIRASGGGFDLAKWMRIKWISVKAVIFISILWLIMLAFIISPSFEGSRFTIFWWLYVLIFFPVLFSIFVLIFKLADKEIKRRSARKVDVSVKTKGRS